MAKFCFFLTDFFFLNQNQKIYIFIILYKLVITQKYSWPLRYSYKLYSIYNLHIRKDLLLVSFNLSFDGISKDVKKEEGR